jgi:hypothetical protein
LKDKGGIYLEITSPFWPPGKEAPRNLNEDRRRPAVTRIRGFLKNNEEWQHKIKLILLKL